MPLEPARAKALRANPEAGVAAAVLLYLAPSPPVAWNIAHPERGGAQASLRHGQGGAQP
jgi:hypothetical protein